MSDNVTVYWVSEELAADDGDAAGDEERDRPLVEEFEGEVIDGDLSDRGQMIFTSPLQTLRLTPPIPSTASVALLIIPIVAAMFCVWSNY